MKILNSIWFNTIGIVCIKNEIGTIKYYIGQGKGINQKEDEVHIAEYGMPINKNILIEFFNGKFK